jgi:AraC-like DNA-binding protein
LTENAVPFAPRADGSGGQSPIAELVRQFAVANGVVPGVGDDDRDELAREWDALRAGGIDHPGLAFALWASQSLLGGVFPTILANTPDPATLLDRLHRFHPIFGGDQVLLTVEDRSTTVSLQTVEGAPAPVDTVDAFFGLVCWLIRQLTDDVTHAQRVHLRRPAPPDCRPYTEMMGEVRFGAARDRCVFDTERLHVPIRRADPAVLASLEPYAERRLSVSGKPWAAQVAELVADVLSVPPTLAAVSRSLALSPRALQLRLADEGTTFSAIVDGAQRDRALTLLDTSDLPISAIASTVGFASPAVLSRAVRRWTGLSPTNYRRRSAPSP